MTPPENPTSHEGIVAPCPGPKNTGYSQGGQLYQKYMAGKRLTRGQAIAAKCADCMDWYADGRVSCELTSCSLYPFMPYRNKHVKDE